MWPISDDIRRDVAQRLHRIVVSEECSPKDAIGAAKVLTMADSLNLGRERLRAGAVDGGGLHLTQNAVHIHISQRALEAFEDELQIEHNRRR